MWGGTVREGSLHECRLHSQYMIQYVLLDRRRALGVRSDSDLTRNSCGEKVTS